MLFRSATIGDGQGMGTILDEDPPTLSINNVAALEGQPGSTVQLVFTVTLSAASSQTVTVNYRTTDDIVSNSALASSDYTASSGALTFSPGQTTKQVAISVIVDSVLESNEDFFVDLSDALNAVILDGSGKGTIRNDDS